MLFGWLDNAMQTKFIHRRDGYFSLLIGVLVVCAVVLFDFVLASFFASRSPQTLPAVSQPPSIVPLPILQTPTMPGIQPNTIEGWKTYQDKGSGFSIQYP